MVTWTKFALALLVIFIILTGGGLLYMYSGAYNIAATDRHTGLARWVLSTTQERSIRAHADDVEISLPADPATLRKGYQAFADMCVGCHGAPGQERGWIGKGMNPEPPDLDHAAKEFSASEIYWILQNGIKMAGMPALAPTHSAEEILELTAFVKQLPEMTEAEYQRLGQSASSETDHGDGHDHTH